MLSHCRPEDLHRCLFVSFLGVSIHLCARCAGLYPALALALVARLAHLWVPETADLLLRIVLPVVGAAAWGLEQAGAPALPLPRASRVLSGCMIGLGLGWVLGLHLRQPWPSELIRLMIALSLIGALGLLARLVRTPLGAEGRDELPEPDVLVEPDTDGQQKKSAGQQKNEVDPRAS